MENWNLHPEFLMSLLATVDISVSGDGKLLLRDCLCKNQRNTDSECNCHPSQVTYIELSDDLLGLIIQVKIGLNRRRINDVGLLRVHQKFLRLRERCQLAISEIDKELKAIDENPSAYSVFYGKHTLKRCERSLRGK